jgi:hypothetical protein
MRQQPQQQAPLQQQQKQEVLATNSIEQLGRQEQMEPMRQLQDDEAGSGMQQQVASGWPMRSCPQRVPEETISRRAYSQMKTRIGNMVMTAAMHFAFLAWLSLPLCRRASEYLEK